MYIHRCGRERNILNLCHPSPWTFTDITTCLNQIIMFQKWSIITCSTLTITYYFSFLDPSQPPNSTVYHISSRCSSSLHTLRSYKSSVPCWFVYTTLCLTMTGTLSSVPHYFGPQSSNEYGFPPALHTGFSTMPTHIQTAHLLSILTIIISSSQWHSFLHISDYDSWINVQILSRYYTFRQDVPAIFLFVPVNLILRATPTDWYATVLNDKSSLIF